MTYFTFNLDLKDQMNIHMSIHNNIDCYIESLKYI